MAKLAIIYGKSQENKNADVFQEKYSAEKFKKQFKCKKVMKIEKRLTIDKAKSSGLSRLLKFSADSTANLSEAFYFNYLLFSGIPDIWNNQTISLFAFSDDAQETAFSINILKEDIFVHAFQIEEQEALNLIDNMKGWINAENKISALNNATDLCSSLEEIQENIGISILKITSDELKNLIPKVQDEIQRIRQEIISALEKKWDA